MADPDTIDKKKPADTVVELSLKKSDTPVKAGIDVLAELGQFATDQFEKIGWEIESVSVRNW